ncbi:MAG: general secretion pathway protein GspB [Pseudomonadota bacterium]|nr:general secretion pathway protein GspB [Pseudomonadota bacterium]
MSLILEALRKSEAERRRGRAPDLSAELPPLALRRQVHRPTWPWIATGLVVLLLAAWWLQGTRPGPDSGLSLADPPTQQPAAAEVLTEPESPRVPPAAAEAAFPDIERIMPPPGPVADTAASASVAAPAPTAATPLASRLPAVESPAAPPLAIPSATLPSDPRPPAPNPGASGRMPTVAELPAEQRRQLPAMKLTMHMWNEQPAQRFVILDGNRHGEGDRVGAAVITRIDIDGVMLDLDGRAVRLPLR